MSVAGWSKRWLAQVDLPLIRHPVTVHYSRMHAGHGTRLQKLQGCFTALYSWCIALAAEWIGDYYSRAHDTTSKQGGRNLAHINQNNGAGHYSTSRPAWDLVHLCTSLWQGLPKLVLIIGHR